jgi:hypothetical protein
MLDTMHKTPEGFTLPRPLLLPDARSFADVLTYAGEWDHSTMSASGKHYRPELVPAPRLLIPGPIVAGRERANVIGPFCSVDLSQLGGMRHRSIAVTATDAAMEAVAPRIVTPDDHLSFRVIGHAGTGRALIILQHGYIIGSHWLAYVDPATIPAYPFAERDAAKARVCAEIRAQGFEPCMFEHPEPHALKVRAFTRSRETGWCNVYHGAPYVIDPAGVVTREEAGR